MVDNVDFLGNTANSAIGDAALIRPRDGEIIFFRSDIENNIGFPVGEKRKRAEERVIVSQQPNKIFCFTNQKKMR